MRTFNTDPNVTHTIFNRKLTEQYKNLTDFLKSFKDFLLYLSTYTKVNIL